MRINKVNNSLGRERRSFFSKYFLENIEVPDHLNNYKEVNKTPILNQESTSSIPSIYFSCKIIKGNTKEKRGYVKIFATLEGVRFDLLTHQGNSGGTHIPL
jgi:hypothetical protein